MRLRGVCSSYRVTRQAWRLSWTLHVLSTLVLHQIWTK